MMTASLDDMMEDLDPERRIRIEERAAEMIAEEMTLRELRKAWKLTQASVARELGMSQDGVSRLEQHSNLLLSTLRKSVEAMGGSLSLIARFPTVPRSNCPTSPATMPMIEIGPPIAACPGAKVPM